MEFPCGLQNGGILMGHAYLNYIPPLPKPKDKPRLDLSPVVVMRDGREHCITSLTHPLGKEGRAEYRRRIGLMLKRQKGMCCFYGFIKECPGHLRLQEASFDHENKRGAGKRDDRILVPDQETGWLRWQNGAAHFICNGIVGSRHIPYNQGKYGELHT